MSTSTTALQRAKEIAQRTTIPRASQEEEVNTALQNLRAERESVSKRLENLETLYAGMLNIELSEKSKIESAIRKAQSRLKEIGDDACDKKCATGMIRYNLDKLRRIEQHERLCAAYPKLSMEPLRWRDENGLPRLVPFQLNQSEFVIGPEVDRYGGGWEMKVMPKFPNGIARCYGDMKDIILGNGIHRRIPTGWRSMFTVATDNVRCFFCKFAGLIPQDAKKKMTDHAQNFRDLGFGVKDSVFIIAEPENPRLFKLDEQTILQSILVDPLVVAYYPEIDADALWLIADFDTTTVEEAMLTHFS